MANRPKDPAKNQAPQKNSAGGASPARPDPTKPAPAPAMAMAVPKPANEIKPAAAPPAATRVAAPVPPKLEPAKPAAEISNPLTGLNPLADALRSAVVKHRIETAPAAGAMPVAEIKPAATPAPVIAKPAVEIKPVSLVSEIKPAVAPTAAKSVATPMPPKTGSIQAVAAAPAARPAPATVEVKPAPREPEKPVGAPAVMPPTAARPDSGTATAKAPIAPVKPEPVVSPMPATIVAPLEKIEPPQKPAVPPAPPVSEQAVVKEIPELNKPEPEAEEPKPSLETPPPPRPAIPSMFVMMIASELTPVAKVGGLADVVYGLARELEARGNAVEIILPKYDCMRYDHIYGLTKAYENLLVPWYGGAIHTTVYFGFVHGRKCYFIEPHSNDNFFNRQCFYGQNDDVLRFAFFCRAALEFMLKTNKHPDIIHCHDWQTALVPVLL